MKTIAKEICVYCLGKATSIRKTDSYKVGVCNTHKNIPDNEINEIIGEINPKKFKTQSHE
jgi:hypothetical protein